MLTGVEAQIFTVFYGVGRVSILLSFPGFVETHEALIKLLPWQRIVLLQKAEEVLFLLADRSTPVVRRSNSMLISRGLVGQFLERLCWFME